ncbi:MAG: hypothetical protein Q7W05_01530 [Deltaproteobacteria bacterium]|nr:hypothetical protein [Deltaproteobacteria bacterium]
MKNIAVIFSLICIGLIIGSCVHTPQLAKFKQLENYHFDPMIPLLNRVAEVPSYLLEALKKLDERDDYRPYIPTLEDTNKIVAALHAIPDIQRVVLDRRLVGIYFVENFSAGGYSDYLYDRDGNLYTILVLNPAILSTGISKWIREKELSAFKNDIADINLTVECREGNMTALVYIMLHETTHIMDYVSGCTPYVEKDLAHRGKSLDSSSFTGEAWLDYDLPLARYDFPLRSKLGFYGAAKDSGISRSELPGLYRSLAATPFTNLYASQNWAEDFAETAAFSSLARIIGSGCIFRVEGPGTDPFEISTIFREPVERRLPILFNGCADIGGKAGLQ